MLSHDPHRAPAGDSSRDVFALAQCQRTPRTATSSRSDPSVTRQQEIDDVLVLAERSTNRM